MKISIKEAINSGAWFQCCSGYDGHYDKYSFRIKILSFEKVNMSEIDNPEEINLDIEGGVLWIMKLQIINLNREKEGIIDGLIQISDEENYEFESVSDKHLCCFSKYAEASGLKRLYAKWDIYMPKIKYSGALLYLLPDEETEFYLTVPGGNIKEV
jgi:hypothetical protein